MRRIKIYAALLGAVLMVSTPPVLAAGAATGSGELNRVESLIKGGQSAQMEQEAQRLNTSAREVFQSTDQIAASNAIYVNHCRSIIQEMFYHLKALAPYYDFKDAIYLRKLQALKKNRARLDRGEITRAQFSANVERIEARYKEDLADAQEFIDEKVDRLASLCSNLRSNTDSIRENLRAKGVNGLPDNLRSRVLQLRQDPVWIDLSTPTQRGRHMETALSLASSGQGAGVKACIQDLFTFFDQKAYGPVFDETLVSRVVAQF